MSFAGLLGGLVLCGGLCIVSPATGVGSENTEVSEPTQGTTQEGELESEAVVQDTEIDGETVVSDASLETAGSDSTIDVSAIAQAVVAEMAAQEQVELLSLEESSYEGTISDSIQSMFVGWYLKETHGLQDYLLFRADQYLYYMVVGDITCNGTNFTADSATIAEYYSRSGTSYTPSWRVYTDSVDVDAALVYSYSNLGDYRPLTDVQTIVYDYALILVLVAYMLFQFIIYAFGGRKICLKN